jgi:preprotein translocase subunit YajC
MILFIIILLASIWFIAMCYLEQERRHKEREKRNRDYMSRESCDVLLKGDKK